MKITTRTILYEHFKGLGSDIEVRIDNNQPAKDLPYGIDVGCVDEWLSDADFDALLAVLNKAKSLREVPKKARAKRTKTLPDKD